MADRTGLRAYGLCADGLRPSGDDGTWRVATRGLEPRVGSAARRPAWIRRTRPDLVAASCARAPGAAIADMAAAGRRSADHLATSGTGAASGVVAQRRRGPAAR